MRTASATTLERLIMKKEREVYFTHLYSNIYKIGCGDTESRLRSAKTYAPEARHVGRIPCPNDKAEDIEDLIHNELQLFHYKKELFKIDDPKIIERTITFHKGYVMKKALYNPKVRTPISTLFGSQNASVFRPICAMYPNETAMPLTSTGPGETYRSVFADEYGLTEYKQGHPAFHSRKYGRTRVYVSMKFWNQRNKFKIKKGGDDK